MFALEIKFKDGVSQPETILVRRPQALVGASDTAHVVIEDMQSLNYQLRLAKGIGRGFSCQPIGEALQAGNLLEGVYEGESTFDLGKVELHVSSLDTDLLLKENEPPDRAGVRVLRQACANSTPQFPALKVLGPTAMIVSFSPEQAIYVGRSKKCVLRLDSADVSSEHARVGFESGQFWVEDLGSTNGTFVNKQQISGRQNVPPGTPIVLGRDLSIIGIVSEAQLQSAPAKPVERTSSSVESRYPVLLTLSDLVRPARLVLRPGSSVVLGRDPSSDMWVGAPHISRRHCVIEISKTGAIALIDKSTNGIAVDGERLVRDQPTRINAQNIIDFGGGITIALCDSKEEEQTFSLAKGAPSAFGVELPALAQNPIKTGRERVDSWENTRMVGGIPELLLTPENDSFWKEWLSPLHAKGIIRKILATIIWFGGGLLLFALGNLVLGLIS